MTRPRSTRQPVTLVRSRIRTPAFLAPRASAWVRSVGLALASFGSQIAPTRSSVRISGHMVPASATEISCASRPWARAMSAVRRICIIRSALAATHSAPLWFQPLPRPTSASRPA